MRKFHAIGLRDSRSTDRRTCAHLSECEAGGFWTTAHFRYRGTIEYAISGIAQHYSEVVIDRL